MLLTNSGSTSLTDAVDQPLALHEVVAAYASGFFPMDDGGATPRFERPDQRFVIPLDADAVHRWQTKRRTPYREFEYTTNRAFEEVLLACAEPRDNDLEPFLTPRVLGMYRALHAVGIAHSFEAWNPTTGRLAAGALSVTIGRACMCESTFHRESGAGNALVIALLGQLIELGFDLCDVQYESNLAARFGGHLIPHDAYLDRLRAAMLPREELCVVEQVGA